jgi:hypothetical protein
MAQKAELWEAGNGRWYYHRVVNGQITDSNHVASRRSARRAILTKWPGIRIDVLSRAP